MPIANKEERSSYNKDYWEKNREKLSERNKVYYETHREKRSIYNTVYRENNKKKIAEYRENNREAEAEKRREIRIKFLEMYGNKCACCGEGTREFLSVDHINGQRGNRKKEKGHQAYRRATKEYDPDIYRILCHNCNAALGAYGFCPHGNLQ